MKLLMPTADTSKLNFVLFSVTKKLEIDNHVYRLRKSRVKNGSQLC